MARDESWLFRIVVLAIRKLIVGFRGRKCSRDSEKVGQKKGNQGKVIFRSSTFRRAQCCPPCHCNRSRVFPDNMFENSFWIFLPFKHNCLYSLACPCKYVYLMDINLPFRFLSFQKFKRLFIKTNWLTDCQSSASDRNDLQLTQLQKSKWSLIIMVFIKVWWPIK